ncbi:hypothetical protein ACOI1H_14845 [Loktanella sp. DJP18]|uniref:hypothetical protein n=1 Tax=Loktanella sp. DJP18 TaxID=3409788 RepID=UPI003BB520B4
MAYRKIETTEGLAGQDWIHPDNRHDLVSLDEANALTAGQYVGLVYSFPHCGEFILVRVNSIHGREKSRIYRGELVKEVNITGEKVGEEIVFAAKHVLTMEESPGL